MYPLEFNREESPIIVFGTGGTGTRLVRELLVEAGIYMGQKKD